MAIHVAPQVLQRWEDESARGTGQTTTFVLASESAVAERALGDAVRLEVDEPGERSTVRYGQWSWVQGAHGLIVTVLDAQDLAVVLPRVIERLEAAGIRGSLEPHDSADEPQWPAHTTLMECRLYANGARERADGPWPGWRPLGDDFDALLRSALIWLTTPPQTAGYWLSSGVNPSVPVSAEALRTRIRAEDLGAGLMVRTTSKMLGVSSVSGFVTAVDTGAWQPAVVEATALMREVEPNVTYGFLKHGRHLGDAVTGTSLDSDWPGPPRVDETVSSIGRSFRDRLAPDAFGVQLLGPGFRDRIPSHDQWITESVGASVLLAAVDNESWFAEPFIPLRTPFHQVRALPVPDVLAEARRLLEPLLESRAAIESLIGEPLPL